MKFHEIEAWVLKVIERVNSGQPNEDSRVELKADWPLDMYKAARRIAGHANAARGEPIVWIIGVDQQKGVIGVGQTELANWYQQIQSQFDEGMAPSMTDLNIPVSGKTVVALFFETDRAPFVVKSANGSGPIHREVPWREGTSIRSANRADLIRLLSPIQRLPEIEILGCELSIQPSSTVVATKGRLLNDTKPWNLELTVDLYIVPKCEDRIVIPFHRCQIWIEVLDIIPRTYLNLSSPKPKKYIGYTYTYTPSPSIQLSDSEAIIAGPGKFRVVGVGILPERPPDSTKTVQVYLNLNFANSDSSVSLSTTTTYPSLPKDRKDNFFSQM
jgi:hypothetical protein